MAATQKATKKAAPRKRGAAARAEKSDEAKTVDFRGLTLTLPKKPPLSLALRARQLKREAAEDESVASIGVLELILGEAQFEALIAKCDAEGLTVNDDLEAFFELIDKIMEELNVGVGES